MERADKAKCEEQIKEHRQTIDQLTHHVRVLRTELQVQQEQLQLGLTSFDDFSSFIRTGDIKDFRNFSDVAAVGVNRDNFYATHNGTHSHHKQHLAGSNINHANTLQHMFASVSNPAPHSSAHQLSRTVPLTPLSATKRTSDHSHYPGSYHQLNQHNSLHVDNSSSRGGGERQHSYGNATTSTQASVGAGSQRSNHFDHSVGENNHNPPPRQLHDSRAVPSLHQSAAHLSHYVDNVEIIRASIPPAPWEQH